MIIRPMAVGSLAFITFLCLALLYDQRFSRHPDTDRFQSYHINLLLDRHMTAFDPVTLNIAIDVAVSDDKDIAPWQLNEPYKSDILNIIIVDTADRPWKDELEWWYQILRHNAIYIDSLTTIIVDYQLIEYLANRYNDNLDPQDWSARGYFVQWIVAHEVGHHKNKHKSAHFSSNAMLDFNGLFSNRRKLEIEADIHLANSIFQNELTTLGSKSNYADAYILFLLDMLERELLLTEQGPRSSAWQKMLQSIGILSRHPQYVERIFLLLKLLSEESDDDELISWVRDNHSEFQ